MQEVSTTTGQARTELPPCCGTGCAVCVLDLIDECASAAPPVAERAIGSCAPEAERAALIEAAACCNTGCLICVRDYPELLAAGQSDAATWQLLEAIEQAQQQLAGGADKLRA